MPRHKRGSLTLSGRLFLLTTLAMIAFAANSILTRQALAPGLVDAASFGTVRVISGAVVLVGLLYWRGRTLVLREARPGMAAALFVYVACFSFAYLWLPAGTGALILFATVQLTMIAAALLGGERFSPLAWAGLMVAALGLVYLLAPGVSAPDPLGAALMIAAGIGWAFYSLWGRGAVDPLRTTAQNFVLAIPLVVLVSILSIQDASLTPTGFALALASGALASAGGYVIWYAALPQLSAGAAATVQYSVPILAAVGGTLLLEEALTWRLLIATGATLGGVALFLLQRNAAQPERRSP
ncbi:MAG: DMT family transporter [Pseudomonadota bacterium]